MGQRSAAELAKQLRRITELVQSALVDTPGDTRHSIAAARSLAELTAESLQLIVSQARTRGVSWQLIGDALGTTRQAAFARFGTPLDPRTGETMIKNILSDAEERATAFFTTVAEHRWTDAIVDFSPTMAKMLTADGLADAYASVIALGDQLQQQGTPVVLALADATVVEVPLHHEAADLIGRISYAPDGTVVGLWFVPAAQALTEHRD
ncbi:MAG: hypothetical protein ABI137_04790 [Antricoccus sp.]